MIKIKKLLEEKKLSTDETFMHECPFLVNNACSVYENRGIICRTFGLIYYNPDGKMQIPFCVYDNLNYSDVFDKEKKMITIEKVQEFGCEIEPKSYNLHYDSIADEELAKSCNFAFGKKGSLLDIIEEDEFFNSKI